MTAAPRVFEWVAPLLGDGTGCWVIFPQDPMESFGKKNLIPIRAEIDGEPYRGSLANMGDGPCLVVLKAIREKIGKQAGDTVRVRLWLDTEPRVVEPPEDLRAGWDARAAEVWEGLSPSHRREYARWIEEAKKPETRQARVAKAAQMLADGKKLR